LKETKLRALHIGKYYPPFHGGIENFLCDLAECQLEQGEVEPSVLVHQHEAGLAEETETANGVFVRRVNIVGKAVFTPLAPYFLRSLNRIIKEQNPDILHLHLPNPSTFWCLFSKSARKRPWIIHWHSDVLGEQATWKIKLLYPWYRIFEQALLRRANAVIATSPPYLASSAPLKNHHAKCEVIPLGISTDRDLERAVDDGASVTSEDDVSITRAASSPSESPMLSSSSKTSDAPLRLLCIGRLTYYKGHALLIKALAEVSEVTLDIVGDGEERQALSQLIGSLGLTQRVCLRGTLGPDALDTALKNCDLVCLPSIERTEAFGLVLLEAARAAKPALVTGVEGSGMSWVVEDGVTGWTVFPESVTALVEALDDIAKNRDELLRRGAIAKARFEKQFQIASVAASVTQLYLSISRPKI
jgi:rhamnosyl/mannosyltransferase